MNLQRGDVLKAGFPHASGGRGKKRPVVVVQADDYNQRLHHAVVAQVTTNLDEKDDPAYLFVKAATPEGKAAGLDRDCLICCTLLSLMTEDRLKEKVGNLSAEMLCELDECLKAALGIGSATP
jgi:mRNA interferase MazF